MNALLPLLLVLAQVETPVQPPVVTPPPADWTALPALIYARPWPTLRGLSSFVRTEVRAGRCAAAGTTLRVELAVQIAGGGQVRRIVPRAIQCPTVEQYASGLVSRMARGNVIPPAADTWYQTALTFTLK